MPRPSSLPSQRNEEFKAAKKVCFIATEDSKTGAYKYLEELSDSDAYHFSEKYSFKLSIFPSIDGQTSPKQVLENLKEKICSITMKGYDKDTDSFWIICDVDRWGETNIDTTIKECDTSNICAVFSNPCSEIWILYHQETIDNIPNFDSSEQCKLAANTLLSKRGKYCNLLTEQQINYAIEHAKKIDPHRTEKWPRTQGSHMYKLLEFLIHSEF